MTIAATAPSTPLPPILETQTPNQTWTGGKAISLALPSTTFEDPQNEALTYTATLSNGQALPSWLTFTAATDSFSGTAPLLAETLNIEVTAKDTSGLSVSDSFAATVVGPPVVATPIANQTWAEGKAISFSVPAGTFTDPQGEALSYAASLVSSTGTAGKVLIGAATLASGLPSWLTFNPLSDSFTGTAPVTAQTLDIEITATDSSGLSVSDTFVATVAPPGPVLATQTPNQTWKEGQAISLSLPTNTFTDPSGQKLTYTATEANGQALPSWLKFTAATDSFSGTAPVAAQTVDVKVTATDPNLLSVSDTFLVTILGAPEVTAQTPNQTWTEGAAFSLALPSNTFTDPQNEGLTYTASQENGQALPSWLTFSAATDTFSGTAPNTAETLDLVVTATDTSGLSASEEFAASVVSPTPVPKAGITVTDQTPNQVWTDGEAVALTLPANTFTDALGLKMTFSAYEMSGPNITNWLYFNPAKDELFGTVPAAMSGTVQLAVFATDSHHMTAEDLFSVTFSPSAAAHGGVGAAFAALEHVDTAQVSSMLTLHG